jgi:hypothetical protein
MLHIRDTSFAQTSFNATKEPLRTADWFWIGMKVRHLSLEYTECLYSHCAVGTPTVLTEWCTTYRKWKWCRCVTNGNTDNMQIVSKTLLACLYTVLCCVRCVELLRDLSKITVRQELKYISFILVFPCFVAVCQCSYLTLPTVHDVCNRRSEQLRLKALFVE